MVQFVPKFVGYRTHICDQIKTNVPEVRDIAPHVGNFGIETLNRYSSIIPAVRVSFLGMRAVKRNNIGQMVGPVTMAVFVFDKDPLVGQVYGPALELGEKIADFIDMNQFGLDYAAAAIVKDIEPIYSEDLDEIGMALVGVTFEQEISIGRSKHDVDVVALDPKWDDPAFVAAGWPADVKGIGQSAVSVKTVLDEKPEVIQGEFTPDDPDLY